VFSRPRIPRKIIQNAGKKLERQSKKKKCTMGVKEAPREFQLEKKKSEKREARNTNPVFRKPGNRGGDKKKKFA